MTLWTTESLNGKASNMNGRLQSCACILGSPFWSSKGLGSQYACLGLQMSIRKWSLKSTFRYNTSVSFLKKIPWKTNLFHRNSSRKSAWYLIPGQPLEWAMPSRGNAAEAIYLWKANSLLLTTKAYLCFLVCESHTILSLCFCVKIPVREKCWYRKHTHKYRIQCWYRKYTHKTTQVWNYGWGMFPSEEPRVNMAYCLLGLIAKQCLGASLLEVVKKQWNTVRMQKCFPGQYHMECGI